MGKFTPITLPNGATLELTASGEFCVARLLTFQEVQFFDTLPEAYEFATCEQYVIRNYLGAIFCWTGNSYQFLPESIMIESDRPVIYSSLDSAKEGVDERTGGYDVFVWTKKI